MILQKLVQLWLLMMLGKFVSKLGQLRQSTLGTFVGKLVQLLLMMLGTFVGKLM